MYKRQSTRFASAHLVIARSGSSTIFELLTTGKPSILIPYKYATDDHQMKNAKAIEEKKCCRIISQDSFNAQTLSEEIREFYTNPGKLLEMHENCANNAIHNSVSRLTDLVLE